jgi:two-component system CheB/CheR fusion protein
MSKERKGTVSNKKQGNGSQKTQLKTARSKRTVSPPMKKAASKKQGNRFYIVGMCASAVGLEAFEQFFRIMPSDSGMAFILIPHLDPTHKSIMVDLIKRVTKMKVFEARDGMQVEPNTIYVIPPDNDLSILEGRLQLIEPTAPRGQRRPIDYFLEHWLRTRAKRRFASSFPARGATVPLA